MDAKTRLESADKYPFDTPDEWWHRAGSPEAPISQDWAHRAARGILHELGARKGVGNELEEVDEDIRQEIVQKATEIIREAYRQYVAAESNDAS